MRRLVLASFLLLILFQAEISYSALDLAQFDAIGVVTVPRVNIIWETSSELDLAGWNLWRMAPDVGGEYIKVNDELIPPEGGPDQYGTYHYQDHDVTMRTLYWYQLEAVDIFGEGIIVAEDSAIPGRCAEEWCPTTNSQLFTSTRGNTTLTTSNFLNCVGFLILPALIILARRYSRKK